MDFHTMRRQGLGIRKIANISGSSRNAVRRALRSLTPPTGKRHRPQGLKLSPYFALIQHWLADPIKGNWTGARMLDELHDRGYDGGRTVLLDYLVQHRPKPALPAEARFFVKAGQQMQVDWGEMGCVPIGGVPRKLYVFVAVLAWSRKMFIRFTTDMQLLTWLDCHAHAFKYFGGVPNEVLIDNLKTGVASRTGSTVRWNTSYQAFAVGYGFTPMAHFPMRPKTKGRVERMMRYVRQAFFDGTTVHDVPQLNENALLWLDHRANQRVHRITRVRPQERFAVEKEALAPVPFYDVKLEYPRTVDVYGMVAFSGVRYSVPSAYARRHVSVQERPLDLTVVCNGETIVTHAYAPPGVRYVQLPEHLPPKPQPRHEAFAALGDQISTILGPLGRTYVNAVQKRAPHAPLAILREVLKSHAEFGTAIVAQAVQTALDHKVVKRETIARICYRFGKPPTIVLPTIQRLPHIEVEQRALSAYEEAAV
ncbi:MAG: IS21 family transposase [Candidatus Eremiobacteraeota bacterium]|nr:IS21 family transposase [Candidatus Eremiobacteraeota bacterium]